MEKLETHRTDDRVEYGDRVLNRLRERGKQRGNCKINLKLCGSGWCKFRLGEAENAHTEEVCEQRQNKVTTVTCILSAPQYIVVSA